MSSIPNSAMPHAHAPHEDPAPAPAAEAAGGEGTIAKLVDTVKAHPRTGLAIGASVVLGAIAAAVIPTLAAAKPSPRKKPGKRAKSDS